MSLHGPRSHRLHVFDDEKARQLAAYPRRKSEEHRQGRALKRLGRFSEAIDVLQDGLKGRGPADESFRRAVVLWNLACYRALAGRNVESVIEGLAEALRLAPEFREDLRTENLDGDLAPLLGKTIFDRWRADVLNGKR